MPTRFEIFPAIGVARFGNSQDHFIFDGPASASAPRRDGGGAMLKQAVEFRVYRVDRDAAGKITAAAEVPGPVRWTVHVANRKACAKRFNSGGRRNNATGNDLHDKDLIIDSGPQTVAAPGEARQLAGRFRGEAIVLGDIREQPSGRLLFRASDGQAKSPSGTAIGDFADNDNWFDTACDGSIKAQVIDGGVAVDAIPAWVIGAPPDYAPGIANLVTLHDVLLDLAIQRNLIQPPDPIVFTHHVMPILKRAMDYQWVNEAARLGYDAASGGHSDGGVGDFASKFAQLGNPAPAGNPARVKIFNLLRDPDAPAQPGINHGGMPRLSDDQDSGNVFALTHTMYRAMKLWSQGQFLSDAPTPAESEPDRLTREALGACSGGPFFPGIEAGRVMRNQALYVAGDAFRLAADQLNPGQITENNALPWQADFHLCRWEESDGAQHKRLGWWPAQRPDDVLTTAAGLPRPWRRGTADSFEGMLADWARLGFVKEDPANPGTFIEQDRDPTLGVGV